MAFSHIKWRYSNALNCSRGKLADGMVRVENEAQAKQISGVDRILPGGVLLLLFRCCELAFIKQL